MRIAMACYPTHGGSGVKRLVDGVTTSFGMEDGLPHEHVQLLRVAPNGRLWAAVERHLVRFNGQACRVTIAFPENTQSSR